MESDLNNQLKATIAADLLKTYMGGNNWFVDCYGSNPNEVLTLEQAAKYKEGKGIENAKIKIFCEAAEQIVDHFAKSKSNNNIHPIKKLN